MAVAARKSVASLMQKTLDRQAALARTRLKFSEKQIEQILLNYAKTGNIGPYSELVRVLRDYPLNDENFRIILEDCLSCVLIMGQDFKQFVEAVCNVEWASRCEKLVNLFSTFIISLVTAHIYHCPQVMSCLVKVFKANEENWDDTPPTEKLNSWSNIHTIIAQIIAIMPMTNELLMETVIDQFPYHKAGCSSNRSFIYNLIWISKYLPSLTEEIMMIIINRMIVMDGNIVESDNKMKQNDTLFDMDVEQHDDISETLDYSMLEVLHWLQEERDPILNHMCTAFEKIILPTYGIRHVQFLLLYTISINQHCADRVLNNLWTVAAGLQGLGPGALATRRTAASHLAGLLARCVRVPNSRLVQFLKTMTDWCHSYISAAQESTTVTDNIKAHGAFHAICHAVFYLIAFKHQHLFMSKESLNFVESLNLPRLVACTLNPLRTCPPQVTRAFSSVTRSHQIVYCQAIIENNARHTLQSADILQYDEWFPYDPYQLPRSGKIIWLLCIDYKDWLKEGDDETQYSNMKKKMEADDDDFLMSVSPCSKLASSLSNGVLPGFRTSESIPY